VLNDEWVSLGDSIVKSEAAYSVETTGAQKKTNPAERGGEKLVELSKNTTTRRKERGKRVISNGLERARDWRSL